MTLHFQMHSPPHVHLTRRLRKLIHFNGLVARIEVSVQMFSLLSLLECVFYKIIVMVAEMFLQYIHSVPLFQRSYSFNIIVI